MIFFLFRGIFRDKSRRWLLRWLDLWKEFSWE